MAVMMTTIFHLEQHGLIQVALTWNSITSSSTGQYLAVASNGGGYGGPIYLSSNFGSTWAESNAKIVWYNTIASSSNGQYYFAASASGVTIGSNYGSSWVFTSTSNSNGIACSSSGQYVVVGINGNSGGEIFLSSNFGSTWTLSSAPAYGYYFTSSSTSGQYLAATTADYVMMSSNFGSTWTTALVQAGPCVCSGSGQYCATAVSNSGIYLSNDFGSTWTKSSAPTEAFDCITSSSSGQYLAAGIHTGSIYLSSDFGSTWTAATGPPSDVFWHYLAFNSDGSFLAASIFQGGVWTMTQSIGSSSPSTFPTPSPTAEPTTQPIAHPTVTPTAPTYRPTPEPSFVPSFLPTPEPSLRPTTQPTSPTAEPTTRPTVAPVGAPGALQVWYWAFWPLWRWCPQSLSTFGRSFPTIQPLPPLHKPRPPRQIATKVLYHGMQLFPRFRFHLSLELNFDFSPHRTYMKQNDCNHA